MVTPPVAGFLAAGFALIPIPSGEKGPRTPGWQRREAAVFGADNAGRFAGHNAGLVHEWSKTCAIDVDDFDAADGWLTARGIDLERLFVVDDAVSVTSGRPNHGKLLYRLPEGVDPLPTFKVKADDAHVILEFRCAGSQDVIFGKHPGGTDYSVTGDPAAMAELPVALLAVWRGLVAQPKAAEKRVNGQRAQVGGRNEMLTREAGKLRRIGLSRDELAAALHQLNASRCDPPLPDVEVDTIARSIGAKPAGADHDDAVWPQALDLAALAEREPHPPQSIMEGIPCGYATGIYGHGGVGKSQIELLRAVCIASGISFCGLPVDRRRVLFVSCEDRENILHWRLTRICSYLGIDLPSLSGHLQVLDLVGRNSILFAPDVRTGAVLTLAYYELEKRVLEYRTEVLVLDGITDTFGGNENSRSDVKHFVNKLLALIPADTGAVVLIGHVNKATAGGGVSAEGYSGSTAWHNSVRGRWYLYPETTQGEDDNRAERTGKLILELQKSNHGEPGVQVEFAWDQDAHLFTGYAKTGTSRFDLRHRDREEQRSVLAALLGCASSVPRIVVPAAMQGPRTGFSTLSVRPEFPDSLRSGKPAKRRFWRQIEALRHIHAIEEREYRRADRHVSAEIVLTTEGMRQCGQ